MMNKAFLNTVLYRTPLILTILTMVLALLSWVGSVYGFGLENVLSADGIRWAAANVVTNFTSAPIAEMVLLMTGISVIVESGILTSFVHFSSLKQKRALLFTLIMVAVFGLLIFCLAALPGAILLNAFGTLHDSPFSNSITGLVFILALIIGNGYGYTSGRFITMRDVINAHTKLFNTASGYFLTMFTAAQLIGCAEYTHILSLLPCNEAFAVEILHFLLYYVPLIPYIYVAYSKKE